MAEDRRQKWHVTVENYRPTHWKRHYTVYAIDVDDAKEEVRLVLGGDYQDARWTVRLATDQLGQAANYFDYLRNNHRRL